MEYFYSAEVNVQILIALMKAHGVRRIIISPGTTNVAFETSVQSDSYFRLFSSADERSAAYMACGMAAETGEPVALSCTGATASRNYLPGLTEAFYRKLPVLAITSSQMFYRTGNLNPQFIDRSNLPVDTSRTSLFLPLLRDNNEILAYSVKVNGALLELKRNGGGPVHINLETGYNRNFNVKELPNVPAIYRLLPKDEFPSPKDFGKNVAILVGAHKPWNAALTAAVETFCQKYNGVVLCDHTSNYSGKYKIFFNLMSVQCYKIYSSKQPDLMIHIGEISGAYFSIKPANVWRVSPDGELRNPFRTLRLVFEMTEEEFFTTYAENADKLRPTTYYDDARANNDALFRKMPDLPFSNIWLARQTAHLLPVNSSLHLAILNSLRAWNFFECDPSITRFANVGGFGIDGCTSSLIGASLAAPDKLFFAVIGDLAFFYDMNSMGNRHVGNNLRILLVNNGCGAEFKICVNYAYRFGDAANPFIAGAGHYGKQSRDLVKHYAQDLGFEYLSAESKQEYLLNLRRFVTPDKLPRSIIFEVFTNHEDENEALRLVKYIAKPTPETQDDSQAYFPKPPFFCGEPSFSAEILNAFGQYEILTSAQWQDFDTEKFIVYFGRNYAQLKSFLERKNFVEGADFVDGQKFFVRPPIPFAAKSKLQAEQYEPQNYFPKPPFFCGTEDFAADAIKTFGQYEILDSAEIFDFDAEKFIVYFGNDYQLMKKIFELRDMIEGKDFTDGQKLFERPQIAFGSDFVPLPQENSPKPQSRLLPPQKARLGFGVMRMPQLANGDFDLQEARRMIDEYMTGDFCYFDFHPAYCKRQAQKIVRELVVERYPRDSFLLANKMPWPIRDPKDYEKIFAMELKACGVEYFDYYLLHALSEKYYEMHERHGGFEFLQKLKAKGFVRRIGFSFHDKPEVLEKILAAHPEIEFVQLQINYLDWEDPFFQSRRLYETAKRYGKQITVMEPIKGGSLANLENFNIAGGFDKKTFAAMALRFVASLDVSIILSGMSATEHVINNRQTLGNPAPLSDDDFATYKKIRDTLKAARLIPCTACRYCVAECPKNIAIPEILSLLNQCEHTGEHDTTFLGRFKIFYRSFTQGRGKAGDCIKCGKCAVRCPQRISIPEHMTEAAKLFENK